MCFTSLLKTPLETAFHKTSKSSNDIKCIIDNMLKASVNDFIKFAASAMKISQRECGERTTVLTRKASSDLGFFSGCHFCANRL